MLSQYKRDNELLKLQLNEKERDLINLNERIQIIENKYAV